MGGRARLLNRGATTVDEQKAWIAARPGNEYNFIQVVKATEYPVGMISLVDVDLVHRRAEPAHFLIGEEDAVKGKPIAAEATRLLYEYAFDTLNLHRVYGPLSADNKKMILWNHYLGMQEEGRLRDHYFLNGKWHDAVLMGLLESEYRTLTIPKLKAIIGY
jgi:RimJ/RimL family protein N-acetyltransferase